MIFPPPALLRADHRVAAFNCGSESLARYLKRFALANNAAGASRTYVSLAPDGQNVAGFYSLAAGSVEKARTTDRVSKGLPNHPVPVILLTRLAVDRPFQGQGLGSGLLRDALTRSLNAAEIVGVRAMLVHAKDRSAAAFYLRFGFAPSPSDPLHLMLLLKDVRRTLKLG